MNFDEATELLMEAKAHGGLGLYRQILVAHNEQIEANRKAIEELRAELDKDSTFQPFGSEPWLY